MGLGEKVLVKIFEKMYTNEEVNLWRISGGNKKRKQIKFPA